MIQDITITAHDEIYAPPERILNVSAVDDVVFFGIGEYSETYDTTHQEWSAQIGVKIVDLARALAALGVVEFTED